MKKIILVCVLSLFTLPAMAENHVTTANSSQAIQTANSKGGFQGPTKSKRIMKDVISAMNASDNSVVELTGNLTMSLGDEDYIFQDPTGEVTVEIDDDIWFGRVVTPEMNIVIRGEVEKDWNDISIDVDSLEIVK
ncbi:YgiW/YdeI family stress tolerance OB fold protein [Vibrio sp. S17_S38]|uniref:YgiW/YdeI family stress tolerance OB fold protein n=1 Tax=Vibrio sp. S17_S38 TaxID=2720229 RepID=UPI001EEEFB9D|nr:NirD/YgiW/YdeI family stress tolerance protein [Vibrio sp. S17_S38]